MAGSQPLWRQAVDAADKAVGPRLESAVRSDGFAVAVGLAVKARQELARRSEQASRRALHLVNLPAGSDMTRLMTQIAQLERQVKDLRKVIQEGDRGGSSNGAVRPARARSPRR